MAGVGQDEILRAIVNRAGRCMQ